MLEFLDLELQMGLTVALAVEQQIQESPNEH